MFWNKKALTDCLCVPSGKLRLLREIVYVACFPEKLFQGLTMIDLSVLVFSKQPSYKLGTVRKFWNYQVNCRKAKKTFICKLKYMYRKNP